MLQGESLNRFHWATYRFEKALFDEARVYAADLIVDFTSPNGINLWNLVNSSAIMAEIARIKLSAHMLQQFNCQYFTLEFLEQNMVEHNCWTARNGRLQSDKFSIEIGCYHSNVAIMAKLSLSSLQKVIDEQ